MKANNRFKKEILFFLYLVLMFNGLMAKSLETIQSQIHAFSLSNGMQWIVLPRHEAPVVSFHVYADVGSANESYGITGISHLLEHMAFKGTTSVGTSNYEEERIWLDRMDSLYALIEREKNKILPDSSRIKSLRIRFEEAQQKAQEYVVSNEFIDLCMKEGDPEINAYTNADGTHYVNAFPSNRLEFWMAITSDRFLHPVFREFYKERDVVMEERRLRVETNPIGKLLEDFLAVAFKAHPYRHGTVGHMSVLRRIKRRDVAAYFHHYYCPSNLTVAIVGDVDPETVVHLAKLYFERIPSGPKPEPPRSEEPEQWGERRVQILAQSQPVLLIGYHRPGITHKDDLVFQAISNILGQGRSSRLYQKLVKELKIAIEVGSFNGWPGSKYPNVWAFYAIPAKDRTNQECLDAIHAEIEKLKKEPVTKDELTKFKRTTLKSLYDQMKNNSEMAQLLAFYQVVHGDWRKLFERIQKLDTLTPEEIQKVANTYFTYKNCTIGEIIPESN